MTTIALLVSFHSEPSFSLILGPLFLGVLSFAGLIPHLDLINLYAPLVAIHHLKTRSFSCGDVKGKHYWVVEGESHLVN